jgi:hypothetical protein
VDDDAPITFMSAAFCLIVFRLYVVLVHIYLFALHCFDTNGVSRRKFFFDSCTQICMRANFYVVNVVNIVFCLFIR